MTAPSSDPHFAISLFRNPAAQVEVLNNYADSYHVDIMDGHFSPSMGLCTTWIEQMMPLCTLRKEVHMMVTDIDHWIDQLVAAGATMLTPHVESLGAHAFRTLRIIRENGCGAGIAVNPLTSFSEMENLLERISRHRRGLAHDHGGLRGIHRRKGTHALSGLARHSIPQSPHHT